jgi:hypothetical protein
MMTDFRALCEELLSALEGEGYTHWVIPPDEDELCLRARAALDEPVVEGNPDLKRAAESARQALEGWANYGNWVWPASALEQARRNTTEALELLTAALDESKPTVTWIDGSEPEDDVEVVGWLWEGPSDEDILRFADDLYVLKGNAVDGYSKWVFSEDYSGYGDYHLVDATNEVLALARFVTTTFPPAPKSGDMPSDDDIIAYWYEVCEGEGEEGILSLFRYARRTNLPEGEK